MKQQFLDLNGLTELVTYLKKSITEQKEILPYASNKLFPSTGNVNCIYIDTATNSIYRWDSSNKKYEILAKAVKSVSISESTENGKITLTVDGVKTTVPIHGLKSAAYTESSAYATAAQGVKAESAVQSISLASGTNNGTVKLTVDGKATDNIAVKGLGSAAYTASSAYATAGHTHTKAQIGLGNVDNTADANKSVKYATSAGSSTTSGAISSSGTLDTVAKLDAFIEGGKVKYATVSALNGLNGMIKNDGICISTPWSSTGYGHQFYINDNGYDLYHRFRNTSKVNNVDTTTWSSWKQILDSSNYNLYAPTKTGSGASGTWGISVTGNAATATKLATARSINGTNFDGSGNIITATWGTARNVTIGSTKKSVNGGADVSWSLSEIGAAAASHSHSYLPLSGGTMSGTAMITWPDSGNWGNSNKNVTFPVIRGGLSWIGQSDGIQLYAVETSNDNLELYLKFTDDNSNGLSVRNKDNTQTARISATGEITASKFIGNLAGTASSASAVPWSGVTGKPSSMPASDVYAWAKASTKPSYSWGEITGKPGTFTPASHSHSYITASLSSSAVPTKAADGRVEFYYNVNNGLANNMPSTNNANAIISLSRHAGDYPSQLGFSSDGNIYYREGVGTTAWKTIITSSNYTSYTTTKTGGGASGTWGINVSGGAAYPTGFNSRATSATWGNQTGILITDWHTSNGGDIQFRDNSGQLNVITDGFFYQNEGRNLVLDSVNYSNYAATKSHTHNYAGSSSAGGNANAAVKLANARKIGSASFDGTADITLSQMGLNVPVEITKADYLAKKKAGTLNANTYYNVIDEYDSANVINDSSVTANSAFSSTKSEKTYAKKSTLVTTTLTASKWTGSSAPYTYVLPVSGATTSNIVEINYASNASSQAIEAYQNAMLADGGQTTNQITIKATEKPTVDIPITIVIRNDL